MNFLEMNGLQTAQTHFKDIFQNNIHRDYADAMSAAMAASPWVWRLQEADMCAAWIDEREAGQ